MRGFAIGVIVNILSVCIAIPHAFLVLFIRNEMRAFRLVPHAIENTLALSGHAHTSRTSMPVALYEFSKILKFMIIHHPHCCPL